MITNTRSPGIAVLKSVPAASSDAAAPLARSAAGCSPSSRGPYYRSQRRQEVATVFGHLNSNRKFSRLLLKGLRKTKIEIGLLSLAHNLRKKSSKDQRTIQQLKENAHVFLAGFASRVVPPLAKNFTLALSI